MGDDSSKIKGVGIFSGVNSDISLENTATSHTVSLALVMHAYSVSAMCTYRHALAHAITVTRAHKNGRLG